MSLHKFADMVAKQGRGDDSLLIHMTPDEVQRLQQFAEANGRSLTINPTTGLPEAGMLSDLFKAVAPIALGAFLGPAGMGITFGGLSSAASAGLLTGGLTSLATGSLSRGLMAGLGAYGGAGLAEGLGGAAVADQVSANMPTLAGQAPEQIADYAKQVNAVRDTAMSSVKAMPFADKMSMGLSAAAENPMTFAKQNLGNIAAAATPIMAGAMVPTTTTMPKSTDTGYIRQKLYDPYTQTYKTLAPVKASEWGNRSFSDAYTNPQTGIAAALEQRAPGMNGGGIVALADGGGVSDTDIFNYFKTPGLTDTQIAADMQKYGVSAADIARATGTQNQQADYEKRFVNTLVAPGTDSAEFLKATGAVGLQNQALADAMQNAGLSQGAQYALTHAMDDKGFNTGIVDAGTGKPVSLYTDIGYTAGALPGDQGGLEGLYGNINYVASGLQNLINSGRMSVADAQNAALAELARTGVSVKDVKAATGKDFGNLFAPKKEDKKVTAINPITGVASAAGPTTTTVLPTTPLTNAPAGTSNPYGNVNNPGDLTYNPDGTITVQPNIPGRPYGGFSGMNEVKNAYTAGGGSLGYTSPAPRTIDEFNQLYNKQTGDSMAAYNYLMGKGANPVQSGAASGAEGIMRPYWSAGMKYKPKFLSKNADGTISASTTSGGASAAAAGDLTKAKSIYVLDNQGNSVEATLGSDGNYHTSSGESYDVSGAPVVAKADGGAVGYAMGGGLGSLGSYSDGGRLLKGPGDGVSDSIPATIGAKQQPARLADGEFVVPARIVSELGNGSTDAGAKKLYAMMDRVQKARGKTTGKNKVAANTRADKYLPA